MYRMATIGLGLLLLGILTGGIIALVILGLAGFTYGVRRLDSDVRAWDGLANGFASACGSGVNLAAAPVAALTGLGIVIAVLGVFAGNVGLIALGLAAVFGASLIGAIADRRS
jgi:hypothetical protein